MELSAKTVVAEPDPSPVLCHLRASQVFPAPGRTQASEGSGDRISGQIREAAWGEGQGTRSEQMTCEVEPAAQRGNLKDAKLLGCRRQ